MFKKAGSIVLPLIVLAGLRRCPQMNMPCSCRATSDDIAAVLVLSSVLVLAALGAFLYARSAKKA